MAERGFQLRELNIQFSAWYIYLAMRNPVFEGNWTDEMKKDAMNVFTKAFQVMLKATDLVITLICLQNSALDLLHA